MQIITEGKDKGWVRCEKCNALLVPDQQKYSQHLHTHQGSHRSRALTSPRAQPSREPVVFISHSHRDRSIATKLQRTLENDGASTYLDQDKIEVADVLPRRLREGVESCDALLLIWSANAAGSSWVRDEWRLASDLGKKIIPYCLDTTPLPAPLQSLVYLTRTDEKVANAGLLKAIFGRNFDRSATNIFPGRWRIVLDAFGMGTATYDLELRPNGQITGSSKIDPGGVFSNLVAAHGLSSILDIRSPIDGAWEYEEGTETLTLSLTARGFGQAHQETIQVRTTGRERGAIQGQDMSGRTYQMMRV